MTREEEITNAALEECAEQILDCKWAFMDGARWADEHPQKGLVNIDKACEWLNNFYNEDTNSYLIDEDIKKFQNYMKGE